MQLIISEHGTLLPYTVYEYTSIYEGKERKKREREREKEIHSFSKNKNSLQV